MSNYHQNKNNSKVLKLEIKNRSNQVKLGQMVNGNFDNPVGHEDTYQAWTSGAVY